MVSRGRGMYSRKGERVAVGVVADHSRQYNCMEGGCKVGCNPIIREFCIWTGKRLFQQVAVLVRSEVREHCGIFVLTSFPACDSSCQPSFLHMLA